MSATPTDQSFHKPKDAPTQALSLERRVVDSLTSAVLLSFAGGALDAFLWLNHGQVYAGVMTGNAVLGAVALINGNLHGAGPYAWALFAYAVGIWLVSMLQGNVKRYPVRISLIMVIAGLLVASLLPAGFPNGAYVFLVVSLTGFLVGVARKVDSYSYNVTVLTGSLRDATIALYRSLNPLTRAGSLCKARDLWVFMLSFCTGAAAGGLLGKHIGNHALWVPVAALITVFTMVSLSPASEKSEQAALLSQVAA